VVATPSELSDEAPGSGHPSPVPTPSSSQGPDDLSSSSVGKAVNVAAPDPEFDPVVVVRRLSPQAARRSPARSGTAESLASEGPLVIDEEAHSVESAAVEAGEESPNEYDRLVAAAQVQREDPNFDPTASPSKRPRVVVPVPARPVTTPGTHGMPPLPGRGICPIRPPASLQPSSVSSVQPGPFTRSRGTVDQAEPGPSTAFTHLSDDKEGEASEEPTVGGSGLLTLDPPPVETEKRRHSVLPPEVRAAHKDAAVLKQHALAVGDQTAIRVMGYVATLVNGWGAAPTRTRPGLSVYRRAGTSRL